MLPLYDGNMKNWRGRFDYQKRYFQSNYFKSATAFLCFWAALVLPWFVVDIGTSLFALLLPIDEQRFMRMYMAELEGSI